MHKAIKSAVGPLLICAVVVSVWMMRERLLPSSETDRPVATGVGEPDAELEFLEVGPQARKNLQLVAKPARPADYWRSIAIPGVVQDRPGVSDRGVTSPAVGAISAIHVYPGDTVRPGQRLVTIQLFSEYLQATQTQLFKASEEIALLREEVERLDRVASAGAISKSRMIELSNEIRRQETLIRAARQELLARGLAPRQVELITEGDFVSSIDVLAPPPRKLELGQDASPQPTLSAANFAIDDLSTDTTAYEVQQLTVELGQAVQAGQLIVELSNHQYLYVVGHAFKREAGWLERAAQEGRLVEIEFADDAADMWPPVKQTFQIRHLSNSIDAESQTFDFYVPLGNQSRAYEKAGENFLVWRFRPGQRARIQVPIEKFEDVFILPSEAVAHEGPEAFVYRQDGDLFKQITVHVVHQDRRHVVIANDGSITPGTFLAQNAGASLRRILKSQSASGEQPGLHVHADGTVHAAH